MENFKKKRKFPSLHLTNIFLSSQIRLQWHHRRANLDTTETETAQSSLTGSKTANEAMFSIQDLQGLFGIKDMKV
jgi:hypothetical protein